MEFGEGIVGLSFMRTPSSTVSSALPDSHVASRSRRCLTGASRPAMSMSNQSEGRWELWPNRGLTCRCKEAYLMTYLWVAQLNGQSESGLVGTGADGELSGPGRSTKYGIWECGQNMFNVGISLRRTQPQQPILHSILSKFSLQCQLTYTMHSHLSLA